MSGGDDGDDEEEEEEEEEREEELDDDLSLPRCFSPDPSLLTSANSLRHGTARSTALAAVASSSSLSPGLGGGTGCGCGCPVAGSTTGGAAGTGGLGVRLP